MVFKRPLRALMAACCLMLCGGALYGGQDIEALLARGLPVESDPNEVIKAHGDIRALPFRPLDQTPLYGLPYGIVQTSVGRLAFQIDDLSLPGKVPLSIGRVYDSGVALPLPASQLGFAEEPRSIADLGPGWLLTYSDRIVPVDGGYLLLASDGSAIQWELDSGGSTLRKLIDHPSDHIRLRIIDSQTIEEDRADMSVWQYVRDVSGIYHLAVIIDRHNSSLFLSYQNGYLSHIENSEGFWVDIHRPMFSTPPPVLSYPLVRITQISDSAGRSVSFTYDALGQCSSWTDANGHVWQVSYDSSKLVSVTNQKNEEILSAAYNSQFRVSSLRLGSGASTFEYFSAVTEVSNPLGGKTRYHFDTDGITTSIEDPDGGVTSISLDQARNISAFTSAQGGEYQFAWDDNHRLTRYTPPTDIGSPVSWTYAYDHLGRMVCASNPKGTKTIFTYNEVSDVTTQTAMTDSGNCIDLLAQDPTWRPLERTWSATYYSGCMLSLTNPRGVTTEFSCNSQGLRTGIILSTGSSTPHVTDLAYDSAGRIASIARPRSASSKAIWHIQYNPRGQVTVVTDPMQRTTQYTYDSANRLVEVSNATDVQHAFMFDDASRLTASIDAYGNQTSYQYDTADDLTALIDPLGNAWTYVYDQMKRIITKTDPLGRQWSFSYLTDGALQEMEFPSGQSVTYQYDTQSRLVQRHYPDGVIDVLNYDPNGLIDTIQRSIGWDMQERVQYQTDGFDQITRIISDVGPEGGFHRELTFEYDPNGNRISAMESDQSELVSYSYDNLDHLVEVHSDSTRGITTMAYDPWTLQRVSLGMSRLGQTVNYSYDASGLMSSYLITSGIGLQAQGFAEIVESRAFTRDPAGQVSSTLVHDAVSSHRTMTYVRDAGGRITRKSYGDGVQDEIEYDALGRVRSLRRVGEGLPKVYEAAFNASGEPTWATDGDHLVRYDYNYESGDPSAALVVTRDDVFVGYAKEQIQFGYDGRVNALSKRNNPADPFEVVERQLWLPQELDQLAARSWPKDKGGNKFYLNDFARPWASYADDGSKFLFPADYSIDILPTQRIGLQFVTRTTGSLEQFALLGRDFTIDNKGTQSSRIPLLFGAQATGSFRSDASLVSALSRKIEVPQYFGGLDDFREQPAAGYFDSLFGGLLSPPGPSVVFNDPARESVTGREDRPTVEAQRRQINLPRCPGGCQSPVDPGPPPGTVEADLGDGVDPGVGDGDRGCAGCRWTQPPASCPLGFAPTIRTLDDQEPFRSSADDPYGVMLSNGEYILGITDLMLPGIGPSLSFERTYRSRVKLDTSMGYGWTHNYQERLGASDSNCNTLQWMRGDMLALTFTWDGVGEYLPPPGTHIILKPDIESGFKMRLPDGKVNRFDSHGRLRKIEDQFGNKLLIEYVYDGTTSPPMDGHEVDVRKVSEVAAGDFATGRYLTFAYFKDTRDNRWRLQSVSDQTGRTVTYSYYSGNLRCQYGNLMSATSPPTSASLSPLGDSMPNGRRSDYVYSYTCHDPQDPAYPTDPPSIAPFQHNLVEVHQPTASPAESPKVVMLFYTNDDRVQSLLLRTSSSSPTSCPGLGSGCVSYTYEQANWPASDHVTKTLVTDRALHTIHYDFDNTGFILKKTVHWEAGHGDPSAIDCTPGGNAEGWTTCYGPSGPGGLLTFEIYPSGSRVDRTFNEMGQVLDEYSNPGPRGDGSGGYTTRVRHFSYEPVYHQVTSVTSPGGRTIKYLYDYQEGDRTGPQSAVFRAYLQEWGIPLPDSAYFKNQDLNSDGTKTQYAGNMVRAESPVVFDADGVQHTYYSTHQYNPAGRLSQETDPAGGITKYCYWGDQNGTCSYAISANDPRKLGYLAERKRLVAPRTDCPDVYSSVSELTNYDAFGNVSEKTDALGTTTKYMVDELSQIKQVKRGSNIGTLAYITNYRHDASGNIVEERVQNNRSDVTSPSFLTKTHTYDFLNQKTESILDPGAVPAHLNLKSVTCYDDNQNVIKKISPAGRVVKRTYEERRLLSSTKYFRNAGTSCTTDPSPSSEDTESKISYDPHGNPISMIDELNHETRTSYDGYDRKLQEERDVDAGMNRLIRKKYQYDLDNNTIKTQVFGSKDGVTYPTDLPRLAETQMEYDEMSQVRKSWDLYDPSGSLPSSCVSGAACGFLTSTYYDPLGRVVKSIDPLGNAAQPRYAIVENQYDELGRLRQTTDAEGSFVSLCYDQLGSRRKQTAHMKSQIPSVPDRDFMTLGIYDHMGRLISSVEDPGAGHLNETTLYAYDARDMRDSMTDPMNKRTDWIYDAAGRLTERRQPSGIGGTAAVITERFAYDTDSNIVSKTDNGGNQTDIWIDGLGRTAGIRYPDGSGVQFEYDRGGRIIDVKNRKRVGADLSHITDCDAEDQKCVKISQSYDYLGRLKDRTINYGGANATWNEPSMEGTTAQSFRYDGLSRLTSASDNNGLDADDDSTVQTSYDTLSRITGEVQKVAGTTISDKSFGYQYDASSRRIGVAYPSGKQYAIDRDKAGRIDKMRLGNLILADYSYMGPELVLERASYSTAASITPAFAERRFANNQSYFDAVGRTSELIHWTATPAAGESNDFLHVKNTFDKNGRRQHELRINEAVAGGHKGNKWSYDDAGRTIDSKDRDLGDDGTEIGTLYSRRQIQFDGMGNWLSHVDQEGQTSVPYIRTLRSGTEAGAGMNQYDRIEASPGNPPTGGDAVTYDFLGNVTDVTLRTGGDCRELKLFYDFASRVRRIERRTCNAATEAWSLAGKYSYDVSNRRTAKVGPGTPVYFAYDRWNLSDEFIGASATASAEYVWGKGPDELIAMEVSSGTRYYFAQDYVGSVVGVRTSSGAFEARFRYTDFGELRESAGTNTSLFPFRYTGQRLDLESGLSYYKSRYYSSEMGRFMSRDPLGASTNLYGYVQNSPANASDPTGLIDWYMSPPSSSSRALEGKLAAVFYKAYQWSSMARGMSLDREHIVFSDDAKVTLWSLHVDLAPNMLGVFSPEFDTMVVNGANNVDIRGFIASGLMRSSKYGPILIGMIMAHEDEHSREPDVPSWTEVDEQGAMNATKKYLEYVAPELVIEHDRSKDDAIGKYLIGLYEQASACVGDLKKCSSGRSFSSSSGSSHADSSQGSRLSPLPGMGSFQQYQLRLVMLELEYAMALRAVDAATTPEEKKAAIGDANALAKDIFDTRAGFFNDRQGNAQTSPSMYAERMGKESGFAAEQNAMWSNPWTRRPGSWPHAQGM